MVTIVMGNHDLSVMCNILKILNILMSTLYLMFYPFILVKIVLMVKYMNMFQEEATSQITIHPLQCMLEFRNIKSKG